MSTRLLGRRIANAKKDRNAIATILSSLLSGYSERLHSSLSTSISGRPTVPHVFVPRSYYVPTYNLAIPNRPELLLVKGPINQYNETTASDGKTYREIPFHKVHSLVVCALFEEQLLRQASKDAYRLLQVRPDMPGVYSVWAGSKGYQVLWSDASGTVASGITQWNNLILLAAYVYSLYCPPPTHFLVDPSITPAQTLRIGMPPFWSLRGHEKRAYVGCISICSRSACGRRTNVWKYEDDWCDVVVIKDSYRDNSWPCKERGILELVHRDGIYPGVVRLLEIANDGLEITTAKPVTNSYQRLPQRTKMRLMMGSCGKPLREAKTVKDILMTIYDVLEIHRGLVKDRGVLHRDVSKYNILMYPKHHPDSMERKGLSKSSPIFIKQVLAGDEAHDDKDMSSALLIDFDNSLTLEPNTSGALDAELTKRVGTPMYIARAVSRGELVLNMSATYYSRMPTLSGQALDLYKAAYGAKDYDDYCDKPGYFHGRKPPSRELSDDEFLKLGQHKHRADHDAESIYWVLVVTLLRAYPVGASEKVTDLRHYWAMFDIFLKHEIGESLFDPRDSILGFPKSVFEDALDPKLHHLGGLLHSIAKQVRPEYGLLKPDPEPEHLHEAMRRLLLHYIVEMDDPIPLMAGWARPLRPDNQ